MGTTVVHGNFEWDSEKAEINIKKHGISFEEVLPMFDDPLFWEQYDSENSTAEETRFFGTAKLYGVVVIVSSYTERKRTRLISARIATSEEEKRYEKWCKQFYN